MRWQATASSSRMASSPARSSVRFLAHGGDVAPNHGDGIVDLVGHPRGELPDGGHPLIRHQLLLMKSELLGHPIEGVGQEPQLTLADLADAGVPDHPSPSAALPRSGWRGVATPPGAS